MAISHKSPLAEYILHHQINILTMMKKVKNNVEIRLSSEHSTYKWITSSHNVDWHHSHGAQFKYILNYLKGKNSLTLSIL